MISFRALKPGSDKPEGSDNNEKKSGCCVQPAPLSGIPLDPATKLVQPFQSLLALTKKRGLLPLQLHEPLSEILERFARVFTPTPLCVVCHFAFLSRT